MRFHIEVQRGSRPMHGRVHSRSTLRGAGNLYACQARKARLRDGFEAVRGQVHAIKAALGRALSSAAQWDSPHGASACEPGRSTSEEASNCPEATGSMITGRPYSSEPPAEEGAAWLIQTHRSIHEIDPGEWNALVRAGPELNPFLLHEFLAALEDSGSVAARTGWLPLHVTICDRATGALAAAVPAYIKGHSYGEYVFDQSWAALHEQLGARYYPKLQVCVPFTPVTGARVLVARGRDATGLQRVALAGLRELADVLEVSSVHVTFNTEDESTVALQGGWRRRIGIQFHWDNCAYPDFASYLAALKQSRRKSIRQERKSIAAQGIRVARLRGDEISSEIWDRFYAFYRDTTDRKWGSAYLTRDFFRRLSSSIPSHVLLVVAWKDHSGNEGNATSSSMARVPADKLVAAALNLVGSHAIFGRNWGCESGTYYKNLHFELCYYQAIEEAIERGLERVEAGAQGEHKLARGYLPQLTYSSHLLRNPIAASLIHDFLAQESRSVEESAEALTAYVSPYKQEVSLSKAVAAVTRGAHQHVEEVNGDMDCSVGGS